MSTAPAAQSAPKPAAAPPPGRLASIKKRKIAAAQRILLYGENGTGKSTLAADAPSPIFLDIEGGSLQLDVARYPFREATDGHIPHTYAQVLAALADLSTPGHEYKTVVIDTVDRLESLIWQHVCEVHKQAEGIESFGYGKGYVMALDVWRDFCRRLDALRALDINVVLLAHAQIKTFKSPDTEDFDRYSLRAHDKAAAFLMEWVDVVGFLTFDEWSSKGKGEARAKGKGTGRRLLKTERTAAFNAKSRLPLPKEIEIEIAHPWKPIGDAIAAAASAGPETLLAQIAAELVRINDPELTLKVDKAVEAVKTDAAALSRYVQNLQQRSTKEVAQ